MTGGWAATNTLRVAEQAMLNATLAQPVYLENRELRAALADMRRALEWVAANDPGVGGEMCRRVLAAADGLTAPPMDLGGMVSDEAVAATLDRRAAAADGTPKDTA